MIKKKMNNLELSFNIVYHGTKWEKKYINTNFNYLKGGPQKKKITRPLAYQIFYYKTKKNYMPTTS